MVDEKPSKVRKPLGMVVGIGIVVAALAALAWYWEPISFYVKLHGWEPDAPGRTVSAFLDAGRKGDKSTADRYLSGDAQFQPLEEGGKWTGYKIVSTAGTLLYRMEHLAPASGAKPKDTEYTYVEPGAALVTVPDAKDKDVKYRLQMIDNTWKITEIRGGELAK